MSLKILFSIVIATIMVKSLETLAFLGHFLMPTVKPKPSPHPANNVGRMDPDFFPSFNFVQGGGSENYKKMAKI